MMESLRIGIMLQRHDKVRGACIQLGNCKSLSGCGNSREKETGSGEDVSGRSRMEYSMPCTRIWNTEYSVLRLVLVRPASQTVRCWLRLCL